MLFISAGNTARKVFDNPVEAASILELDVTLIRRLAVVLKALTSGKELNISRYHSYALEVGELYRTLYPWAVMSPTLHKVLLHGAFIAEKAPFPLGELAEDAQESINKLLRDYRKNHARQSGRSVNNEDIFKRLLIRSDPYISSLM